jgi:hypothetical protein
LRELLLLGCLFVVRVIQDCKPLKTYELQLYLSWLCVLLFFLLFWLIPCVLGFSMQLWKIECFLIHYLYSWCALCEAFYQTMSLVILCFSFFFFALALFWKVEQRWSRNL